MKTLFTTLLVFLAITVADAQTVFYFSSSPTSFVEYGQTETITPGNGLFTATLESPGWIELFVSTPADSWDIQFMLPNVSVPFQVGQIYSGARYASANGLSHFTFDDNVSRAHQNNVSTADVVLLGFALTNNELSSLALDFVQDDNGTPSEWNFGSLRYDSSIPVDTLSTSPLAATVPEPSTAALVFGSTVLGIVLLRRPSK